jgi:hypothetical protein
MTTITVYKIESKNDPRIYISVTTCTFSRLVGTMKSRFLQYGLTDDQKKKKLYHHVCFDLLENATFSNLEEYECKPNERNQTVKLNLMTKHCANIDPTILIKPKRPLRQEYKRQIIDRRYRANHRVENNTKQREKRTCDICHGRYTRANKYNHLNTTKHRQTLVTINNCEKTNH